MSADNFTGQNISSTFQRLLQLSDNGDYITNGTGSIINLIPVSSSYALTASYIIGGSGGPESDPIFVAKSASFATTGSNYFNGSQYITGSLTFTGSSAIQGVNYIDFLLLNQANHPTHQEGRVHWFDDTKTLNVDTDVNNFYIELGHQNVIRVRNENTFTLTKGKIVYINGEAGNKPTVTTASWTGDQTSAATIGWVVQDIGSSNTGYVLTNGILRDINTNAYAPGTMLYLSSSGNWTSTPPDAPLHEVRLGQVITQATAGTIYVNIMNGYELTELHDVKTTSYSTGDLLIQSNSLWINSKQLTGSYGLTGSLTFVNGGVTGSLFGTASYADRAFRTTEIGDDFYQIDVFEVGYALSQAATDTVTLQNIQSNTISTITIDNVANAGFANTANFAYSTTTAETASFLNTGTYQITSSWANTSLTSSYLNPGTYAITASWATNTNQAATASYINPLNQNVIITGSVVLNGGSSNLTVSGSTYIAGGLSVGGNSIASYNFAAGDSSFPGLVATTTGTGTAPNIDKVAIWKENNGDLRIRGFSYTGVLTIAAAYLTSGGIIKLYGGSNATYGNGVSITDRLSIGGILPGTTLAVSGSARIINGLQVTGSSIITGSLDVGGSLSFTPPSTNTFNGEIVKFGAGTLTTGQLYFLSSSGTWSLSNANSTGSSTGMLGIAVGSSPTTNGLLIRGYANSGSFTQSTGSILYMATSSGIFTETAPSSSGHVVRVIGYKTTISNTIYFMPDATWVTLA